MEEAVHANFPSGEGRFELRG